MSSNDRGDDPRVTQSAAARQRPNRPTSGAQRVGNDPRDESPRKRPEPTARPANSRRPSSSATSGDVTRNSHGSGSVNGNAVGKEDGNAVGKGNGSRPSVTPDNVVAIDATTTAPKRAAASPASSTVASPVTSPVTAVPHRPAAPMPPPPALAPTPVPHALALPPSVFDDEAHATGPIAFESLFDPEQAALGAPRRQRTVQFTQTGRRSRPRLRRVTRVVRHVDPWSVFKVALCFSMVLYGVCLTAGVLLWNVAYTTGTIDNVQRFFESFGWDTFRFKGGELFHNAWIAGLFAALGLTGLILLAATLFNLITDLVGGIRVTVLEEEVVERNPLLKGPLLRRRTRAVSAIVSADDLDLDRESADSATHLS